jgi:hypothetical protein
VPEDSSKNPGKNSSAVMGADLRGDNWISIDEEEEKVRADHRSRLQLMVLRAIPEPVCLLFL